MNTNKLPSHKITSETLIGKVRDGSAVVVELDAEQPVATVIYTAATGNKTKRRSHVKDLETAEQLSAVLTGPKDPELETDSVESYLQALGLGGYDEEIGWTLPQTYAVIDRIDLTKVDPVSYLVERMEIGEDSAQELWDNYNTDVYEGIWTPDDYSAHQVNQTQDLEFTTEAIFEIFDNLRNTADPIGDTALITGMDPESLEPLFQEWAAANEPVLPQAVEPKAKASKPKAKASKPKAKPAAEWSHDEAMLEAEHAYGERNQQFYGDFLPAKPNEEMGWVKIADLIAACRELGFTKGTVLRAIGGDRAAEPAFNERWTPFYVRKIGGARYISTDALDHAEQDLTEFVQLGKAQAKDDEVQA